VRWTINNRSDQVTTTVGAVAVRIDGDTEGSPLLLCQRFRGTMDPRKDFHLAGAVYVQSGHCEFISQMM
jgi:hypothetical protein